MIEQIKKIDYTTLKDEFYNQYLTNRLIINDLDLSVFLSRHNKSYTKEYAFKNFLLYILEDYTNSFFVGNKQYSIHSYLNLSTERLYNIIQKIDFRFFNYVAMSRENINQYIHFNLQYFIKSLSAEEYQNLYKQKYNNIQKIIKQSYYYLDQCFNYVNKYRPYSSASFINRFKKQKIKQFEYLKDTVLVGDSNFQINLIDMVRTHKQELAEKINLTRSIEKIALEKNYHWVFITFTLPSRFHPNPLNGSNNWDGSTIKDSHKYFTKKWARIRTNLNDRKINFSGINVNEFHKDGCPHYHCLMFIDSSNINTLKDICLKHFNESTVDFNIEDKSLKDSAKASSYIFKYIFKTLGFDISLINKISNDEVLTKEEENCLAHSAVRTAHGIRGFNVFGIEKSLSIYRQFMKTNFKNDLFINDIKDTLLKSKTAYSDFLELKQSMSMSLIKNEKKSILGIIVNGVDYMKMLFKTFKKSVIQYLKGSTVILNYSSKDKNQKSKSKNNNFTFTSLLKSSIKMIAYEEINQKNIYNPKISIINHKNSFSDTLIDNLHLCDLPTNFLSEYKNMSRKFWKKFIEDCKKDI